MVEILLDERLEDPPYIMAAVSIDYVGPVSVYDLESGEELMSFVSGGAEPLNLTVGWAQPTRRCDLVREARELGRPRLRLSEKIA